jgi:xanthine dehydrogenase molybdopterin-binding subunit B
VDVGTIINRATVDGQIYGGLAQGIGLALTEDFEDLKFTPTSRTAACPTSRTFRTTLRSSSRKRLVRSDRSEQRAWAKRR